MTGVFLLMLEHMSMDVAAAADKAAARHKADPVFTLVVTSLARVKH